MKDFRELEGWKRAHRLALDVYRATEGLPKSEQFGLTIQLRRSATSIPTNIAEGCGRDGDAELARFLQIARGACSELEYLLLLAKDLGYLQEEIHIALTADVKEVRMILSGLLRKMFARPQ